ncbi:amino acid/polyamine/organocation transporter (APC superfamily) [Algoriphagus boseongensis]|uniref:Amino acid/polyamine/organocation transporter (APC superfamily) n=1 Tax=Algoriphagus boseongensis TaxID=1442587 RepID=A0A4R6T6P9_9BACT|nr:APC family permease [Algoriphagus boseongensis]TDQ18281.1 amino acid/polyamine/organocation transporter (APC superfamily) [Algoriphagus boseongensis]
MSQASPTLSRQLGLLGLTATGICSMIGASIYVVPFMIQRNVPGIGPYVLPAFLFAAIPAVFAAFAYTVLSSAMPRAGGSYLYASRALHPFWGFVASFSQWFGLSIVIGVIAYVVVPFFRDVALALGWAEIGDWLEIGTIRVTLSLLLLWTFVGINLKGIKSYEKTLIPLMILMFVLGGLVIISGFFFNQNDFIEVLKTKENREVISLPAVFDWGTFLSASALLFSSFIGFDAIAQAGGEAKNPSKNLPRAIGLAIFGVGIFYFSFTSAVYHAIPWEFVASEALEKDLSAAGLLAYLLPSSLGVVILLGAAIALLNDLPAMILSVSRLVFSWAEDGIFPRSLAKISSKNQTPARAIVVSGSVSTIGVLGSHFAGDFFLGIDIMVTSMLVNFLLMCLALVFFKKRNPSLHARVSVFKSDSLQLLIGIGGILFLTSFLIIHVSKDLKADVSEWYFHSTWVWLLVMGTASLYFFYRWKKLKQENPELEKSFKELPEN